MAYTAAIPTRRSQKQRPFTLLLRYFVRAHSGCQSSVTCLAIRLEDAMPMPMPTNQPNSGRLKRLSQMMAEPSHTRRLSRELEKGTGTATLFLR